VRVSVSYRRNTRQAYERRPTRDPIVSRDAGTVVRR
jgi:hypothetical protein